MLTVTINFTLHEITAYERLFGRGRRNERAEEEPRQPRVNYARIAPIVSNQPNVFLHPNALTRRDVNGIFKSTDADICKTTSPIIYKFGEKPFSALEASKKEEGQERLKQWLFANRRIGKMRDELPRFASTRHSEVRKIQRGIRKTAIGKVAAKNKKKRSRVIKKSAVVGNKVQSSSGLSARNKPRATDTKKKQTRAQKLGSSCVQSNKPSVTPTRSSPRRKSIETVRGSADCTKKAPRTTKTTKSVRSSSRVVCSHK